MKLYFFRGQTPNFGDELNEWLMPRVFPNFFDDNDQELLLAIGSVLFDTHPKQCKKIVFGSGFGGYTALPEIDDTWKFYCVRGPLTAKAFGLSEDYVAGDTAILLNNFRSNAVTKDIKASFMPHFRSIERGHWQAACRLAGINYIDPRRPVEEILNQIERSRMMISEAMHGVITADALRVPWVAIRPFDPTHHMKWYDWAGALNIDLKYHKLPPTSLREAWISRGAAKVQMAPPSPVTQNDTPPSRSDGIGLRIRRATRVVDPAFVALAAIALRKAAHREPALSSDAALGRALDRLQTNADRIKRDFG